MLETPFFLGFFSLFRPLFRLPNFFRDQAYGGNASALRNTEPSPGSLPGDASKNAGNEKRRKNKKKKKTKRENPRRTEGRPAGDEAFPGNDPRSFFERRREGTFRSRASQRLAKGVGERERERERRLSPSLSRLRYSLLPFLFVFAKRRPIETIKSPTSGLSPLLFFFPPRGFRIRRKAERFFFRKKTRKELACGSQAFIATLLFDPSMSALPIIAKQNSPSVGLFTH
jgi:hypothetical protein